MSKPIYFHKLISPVCREVVFAHFEDPEAAREIEFSLNAENFLQPKVLFTWSSTKILAEPSALPAHLKIHLPFGRPVVDFDNVIGAYRLSEGYRLSVNAYVGDRCVRLECDIEGESKRREFSAELVDVVAHGDIVDAFELVLSTDKNGPLVLDLLWLGFGSKEPMAESKLLAASDHEYFFKAADISKPKFAAALLFDENALVDVREKLVDPVWSRHFSYMQAFADECLQRDPFADVQAFNPGYDERFVRLSECGRSAFYWEALIVAFVGLVRQDEELIRHAQRYILCMVNASYWFSSAEEVVPSSPWDARAFVAEMTTTSLAILWDWLDFTFSAAFKNVLAKALWRRGMSPVQGDLMKFPYMKDMNQGAVFCRPLVLGGLILETRWQMGEYADQWRNSLMDTLRRLLGESDAYKEGPVYLCQFAHGVLMPMIAWSRKRNMDWRRDVKTLFKPMLPYLQTLAQGRLGTCTPVGDSRVEEIGGDLLPLLAAIDGKDVFCNAVSKANLESGAIFRSSGTLTNSGGILALVYGPKSFDPDLSYRRPALSLLKKSGTARSTRMLENTEVSLLLIGKSIRAGHAHQDAGAIVLEVGEDVMVSDPGMVAYGQSINRALKGIEYHSILIPLQADGQNPAGQNPKAPAVGKTIKAKGNRRTFDFTVDLDGVWGCLAEYSRQTCSSASNVVEVIDRGYSLESRRFLFRLVSPQSVHLVDSKVACIRSKNVEVTISANWATECVLTKSAVDLQNRELTVLDFVSEEMERFELRTTFSIKSIS